MIHPDDFGSFLWMELQVITTHETSEQLPLSYYAEIPWWMCFIVLISILSCTIPCGLALAYIPQYAEECYRIYVNMRKSAISITRCCMLNIWCLYVTMRKKCDVYMISWETFPFDHAVMYSLQCLYVTLQIIGNVYTLHCIFLGFKTFFYHMDVRCLAINIFGL